MNNLNRTKFPKGEPNSLYHRDILWISSYRMQNSFQLRIIDIHRIKSPHKFNYYTIHRIVLRVSEVQAPRAKGKQIENGSGS